MKSIRTERTEYPIIRVRICSCWLLSKSTIQLYVHNNKHFRIQYRTHKCMQVHTHTYTRTYGMMGVIIYDDSGQYLWTIRTLVMDNYSYRALNFAVERCDPHPTSRSSGHMQIENMVHTSHARVRQQQKQRAGHKTSLFCAVRVKCVCVWNKSNSTSFGWHAPPSNPPARLPVHGWMVTYPVRGTHISIFPRPRGRVDNGMHIL